MTRNLDDGKQIDVRIMEFSKAFDKVSHNFLTHKLKHYGIRGKVNNWIESFLSGRTQAVIVEGVKSTYPPLSILEGPRFQSRDQVCLCII